MRSLAVTCVAAAMLICTRADAERLTNTAVGLSIEKPDDWCVLSSSAVAEDHRQLEMSNPQLKDALDRDSYTSVFAFFRQPKKYQRIAITLKVGTEPADPSQKRSGQEALESMLPTFSKLLDDVKVVSAPETMSFAGQASGYMALAFTSKVDGKTYSIASEAWAVPHGNYFIVIGATYPLNDDSGGRAAIMKVVNSIKLIS